ncbi:hypothetical protein BDV98DRAFT_581722 [Pterulicium gracile]|uniref:Uncharacterized protein n=1 Tax=Pterulicium gracile TaxID=1884261 RepID=A0A5C3QNE7_9AGAR|nr:hypothetical protein BDV98DRAFT_581722 [Pterula gracilis]
MPSLRRSVSSPAVRSSPYPTVSSALSSSIANRAGAPGGSRRSSASEVSNRRVLADLDWWTVMEGQVESDSSRAEQVVEDFSVAEPSNRPTTSVLDSPEFLGLSPSRFAALSLGPRTPPRRRRVTRHTSESRLSSLESTPEAEEVPTLSAGEDEEEDDVDDLVKLLITPDKSTSMTKRFAPRRRALGRSYSSPYPVTSPTTARLPAVKVRSWFAKEDYADFTMSPLSCSAPDFYD